MTAAIIGASLALVVGVVFQRLGFARERSFYPTIMIVIALLYVLFASIDGSSRALVPELVVAAAFISAAIAGFKGSPWFVVAALAGHGIYDLAHPHLIANRGVPSFWPDFCSTYDIVAAAYLAVMQVGARSTSKRDLAVTA
jgi:hypothetical protein